jgi:FkbH-like protein
MYYLKSPQLTIIEIESLLESQPQDMTPLKISVLRNITVEGIEPYLRYQAAAIGCCGRITFGRFDQIPQDVTSTASGLLAPDTDVVLVFTTLATLSPALDSGFTELLAHHIAAELERLEGYFRAVIRGCRARTDAPILWYGFESPVYATLGIADDQREGEGQDAAIKAVQSCLKKALAEVPEAYYVNADRCLARLGAGNYYDIRYWHIARAPFTLAALAEVAQEIFKFIRAFRGGVKKCLVLDCDNTLWGGILGEDGSSAINIGPDPLGSAYLDFQREILSLHQRGIILALCSKNNEQDVLDILDHHPDMLLRRKHFAAWRINWNDKAANLCEIAAELNIGTDSLMFVDDSEFEINLVRKLLPQVQVLQLNSNRPAEYRWLLAASGAFDSAVITKEDRERSAFYRSEHQRKEALVGAATLIDYYRTLGIEIQVARADKFAITRVAQQTQKTNQFNLTARRYSATDVMRFLEAAGGEVFVVRARDKFGDMGIIGTCICQCDDDVAVIDTLLLSCRALGRGIESCFLDEVLHLLAARGAKRVYGQYIATAKNSQVASFFQSNGFTICTDFRDEDGWFCRDLRQLGGRKLAHFAVVESPLGRLVLNSAEGTD